MRWDRQGVRLFGERNIGEILGNENQRIKEVSDKTCFNVYKYYQWDFTM